MAVSSHVAFRNSFAVAWTDVEYRTTVCCVLLINGRGSRGQRVLARVHRWTFRQRPAQAAARTRGPGRPWLHPDASPGDRLACGGWLVGGRFGSRPLCLRLRVCVLRLRFGSRSVVTSLESTFAVRSTPSSATRYSTLSSTYSLRMAVLGSPSFVKNSHSSSMPLSKGSGDAGHFSWARCWHLRGL
jgi:hypothetical protein